ncbi:MAG: MaoC family dehydratase N-terminal domain-containing protein [Rhodobacteraceae bacterium]|nr:MaoC family dehydratase N-terminal domain-containing protein [Paracoccaceae bacterium]
MHNAIGRTRTITDRLDPARAAALHATLGLAGPPPLAGDTLPPFWHYIHFWEPQAPSALGRDGHPKTGDFIPDTGLPRRMWAGGRLDFQHPVRLGQDAEKTSTIAAIDVKSGRSGDLAIVCIDHEITQRGQTCIRERQDLVYRADPDPDAPAPVPPTAPGVEAHCRRATFDTTLLFRYSALTFNGHRIHYDRDYCANVEGYPGLVVHGPLLAQLLIHEAEALLGGLRSFEFRATAPLFDFEAADLCARPDGDILSLWVRGPDGRQCMIATAT